MASDLGDGDYLGAYRRFFVDFLDKVNPDDQLPIKTSGHDVTEAEIVGETVHMTLQYLNQQLCPPSLQCYIVQQVIEEIKATCRKEPETCGFRQEENTYAPLKLMQAIAGKVNEICQRYLENSRLALLPPPPSTPMPLATAFAIKNTRRKMEDRHVVLHDLNTIFNIKDDSVASYYAVFDGHAGYQAAVYCAAHLHQYLAESRHYPTDPERALRDAFLMTDELFIQKSTRQTLSSGTTAVCALILKKKLYVAWVGDSQAALAKRGSVSQLVNPHKPDRNDERERVEVMGGTVMHNGIWRVNGNLAVSRAIGDAQYKPYVTGNPEIVCISLDGYEDFLIIACDGLWDYVTENEAAGLVYREVHRDPYDYDSVSQRLVEYAKNQGSFDNITVIVVFLTAPLKIASRPQYGNPLIADVQLNNMDPDNRFVSNSNGQFDVNSPFAKQPSAKDVSPDLMEDDDPYEAYEKKSSNGKHHENGVPVRDYDADEDDEDLGPETDVDALDDVADSGPTLADVSRQLFPEKQDPCEVYEAEEGVDEDTPPSPNAKKTNQQALIPEADNVGDSEDSEDEWNYYRIEPNKEKDPASEEADTIPVAKGDSDIVDSIVVSSSPSDHGDVLEIEKEQVSGNNYTDSCSSESDSEREVRSKALIDAEISPDSELRDNPQPAEPIVTKETNDCTDQLRENEAQVEDMDFQLNPNAAEFVPVSPTPIVPTRTDLDAPIAGSPLKQTPLMDDMKVPSRLEFENEVRHRPGEIEEKSCSNGELVDDLDDEYALKKTETAPPCSDMLDESEVSSTKAEFGDESSFLTISEFHRTGVSNLDGSFADTSVAFDDSTVDPMTKSFGPGEFVALGNSVDLNAVHDLTDADLMTDEGSPQEEQDEKIINLLNIEKSDEPTETNYLSSSTAVSLPDNRDGNVMDSSSPVSSLHAYDIHQDARDFGNEIDKSDHKTDGSIMEMLAVERTEEKHTIDTNVDDTAERTDPRPESSPGLVDETNVTSKLLEMDLEDRGSQDCGFEKCNETSRAEEPKLEPTMDNIVGSTAPSMEPTDFVSSPLTEDNLIVCSAQSDSQTDLLSSFATNENLIECLAPSEAAADSIPSPVTNENLMDSCSIPESLPIASANFDESSKPFENPEQHDDDDEIRKTFGDLHSPIASANFEEAPKPADNHEQHDIDEMVKSFGDLRANDESAQNSVAREVPVLLNPLDLNVESTSRSSMDNLAMEDPQMIDYVVAKPPESPGVAVSPLAPQPTPLHDDFGTIVGVSHEYKSELNETHPENEETASVATGLKLSESLQEFTGLEQQLNPARVTNGLAPDENPMEIHDGESKKTDVAEKQAPAQYDEEVVQKVVEKEVSLVSSAPSTADNKTVEPASCVGEVAVVAAVAAAASTAAAAAAAKPSKAKPTTKGATKSAAPKTTAANKSTPTSPTKPAVPSARASATAGPKRPSTTTTAARPNKLDTGTKAGPAAPGSKTTTATKGTMSAPKIAARLSTSSASSPRGKLPGTTNAKPTTTLTDKKPTSNGDTTKSSVSAVSKVGSSSSRAPAKPLVKSAPSARSTSSSTAATAKPRPASTTTNKRRTNEQTSKSSNATGTVGTTTQRPKTAPAGGANSLATKSRLASSTGNGTTVPGKSLITEKQIKDTANKQISSSRTSTTTTASKNSRTSITSSSSTTTASKRVGAAKTTSSAAATALPPAIKKPAPGSRHVAKSAASNAKSNTTKTTSTTTSKTKIVVQNGVCKADQETNVVTSTTVTRTSDDTNEEDVPKKDASPVEMPTDNQLIITAD